MQLVTSGKRAARYLDTGRNRLKAMRLRGIKNGKSFIGIPGGGSIICQLFNNIERLLIRVPDPYIIYDLYRESTPEDAPPFVGYLPIDGGVLGEPFEPSGYDGQAILDDTQFSSFPMYVAANQHLLTAIATESGAVYVPVYLSKINAQTNQTSFIFGGITRVEGAFDLPDIDVVTIGHVGPGTFENLYAAFTYTAYEVDAGEPEGYKQIFPVVAAVRLDFNNPDISDQAYALWPPVDANAGRLDLLPAQRSLCSVGKDRVAFIQRYFNPIYGSTHAPDSIEMPSIVIVNVLEGTFTRRELWTLTPSIPKYPPGEEGEDFPTLYNTTAVLGYLGNGVIIMAASYGDPDAPEEGKFVFRSADYGATWTLLDYRIPITHEYLEFANPNDHAVVSLAPGVAWIYTAVRNISDPELDEFFLHTTENGGLSWNMVSTPFNRKREDGTWLIQAEDALAANKNRITPVYRKASSSFVYAATRYSADGTAAFLDIYDSFSPTATKLYTITLSTDVVPFGDVPRAATYFEPRMPLLPGHPGELGDANTN